MELRNKKILIISPQNWDHIKVSKHHYAIELSKRNNTVFFLNPPTKKLKNLKFRKKIINPNLYVIENSFFFPYNLKFHFKFLFNFLLTFQIKRITRFCDQLDIVWSFSPLYPNLKLFDTDLSIYHPVDLSPELSFIKTSESADIIFGVTKDILNKFSHGQKHLINHGISSDFINSNTKFKKNQFINIAYCGNLDNKPLNTKLLISLINKYKDAHFHFIGPYTKGSDFISKIVNLNNVTLYGKILPKEIVDIYESIDIFLLCYDINSVHTRNRGANSHKLLEYISSGKVVISHYMEFYEKSELIEMNHEGTNESFSRIFETVYGNLDTYNSQENIEKRIKFAEENTYQCRLNEIEKHIKNLYTI